MALTDDESAVLRTIAAQLSREDPRLVSSLRSFTSAADPRTSLRGLMLGLVAVVVLLLGLAAGLRNVAAVVLAVTLVVLAVLLLGLARRRGWT